MQGIIFVEDAKVEATTGHMRITFRSGDAAFEFYLPGPVALMLRETVMKHAWQVCCAPDAEVVKFSK